MIDAGRYTSGRIAVANLSASIGSLELRRAAGATFEDLLALSKLLFVRGDLLGRIADHDRAELIGTEAIALSPDSANALYIRARLAGRFHRFEEANALLDQALAAGYPGHEVDAERAALLQATGRYREALALRQRLAKDDPGIHTRWRRSRRCWRKWVNGQRRKTAMRPRSLRMMASHPCPAANCCSNGA